MASPRPARIVSIDRFLKGNAKLPRAPFQQPHEIIVEEIMTDIMFELPDSDYKGKFVVTDKVVRGEQPLFTAQAAADKKSA